MSTPILIVPTDGVFKLADTEAGLAAATEVFECQVQQATLVPSANLEEVAATWCAPAGQTAGKSSWALELVFFQDWTAPGGGLSGYAYTNDAAQKWFSLALDRDDIVTLATGQVTVVAGDYGGVAGTPLSATVTWPCIGTPAVDFPALAAAAA